ncbi:hypothetical protein E2C01_050246 [Portunus trituberculatus]|uniref:Uncharacterized protein n=1 Tax=Portunus trituberculatus TaxID=210409 RepID=A0A5B7GG04_PORTR|nr:hypothetical protein [Portunus trituberculatus]
MLWERREDGPRFRHYRHLRKREEPPSAGHLEPACGAAGWWTGREEARDVGLDEVQGGMTDGSQHDIASQCRPISVHITFRQPMPSYPHPKAHLTLTILTQKGYMDTSEHKIPNFFASPVH